MNAVICMFLSKDNEQYPKDKIGLNYSTEYYCILLGKAVCSIWIGSSIQAMVKKEDSNLEDIKFDPSPDDPCCMTQESCG